MIRLVQEFGAHAGRQLSFDKPHVRVGRAPDSDVVFDAHTDLDASARHCEIALVDQEWFVVDAGSRNGTFVNAVRVQRQCLKHGDVIGCGLNGPRLRVEFAPASVTAPSGSGGPVVNPFAAPVVAPPPAPFAAPPPAPFAAPPPAPFAAPPPAPFAAPFGSSPTPGAPAQAGSGPFSAGVSAPPVAAFGGRGGTVAMPEMALPGPGGVAPAGPRGGAPYGGSVGQHLAASLPADAQVGKRTVALMIDQALAAQQAKSGGHTGLKVMVALLTVLVLGGLGAGAWYVVDGEPDDERPPPAPTPSAPPPEPNSVGARIAAANEGNIYLLAMRRPDGRVQGFCTGFAVNENTLATNAHCVRMVTQETPRGAQLFALRNKGNGAMIPARAVYLDARFQNERASRGGAGYDVGLVQTEARLAGWVRLASAAELFAVREGDGVFVYGFPGMTMNERSPVATITLGLLNRVTDFFDNAATPPTAQKLQHSAQTSGGSSGSPIFLPSGAVIGVNAGSLSDEERQVVTDPTNGQRREVEVNRGSNFKYGMRADLIREAMAAVQARVP